MKKLTEDQFTRVQDAIDAALRSTKRGSEERSAVEAKAGPWEVAFAMPVATARQREERFAALFDAASAWIEVAS